MQTVESRSVNRRCLVIAVWCKPSHANAANVIAVNGIGEGGRAGNMGVTVDRLEGWPSATPHCDILTA